jgi:hypothetical protein
VFEATSSDGNKCVTKVLACRIENVESGQIVAVSVTARNSAGASESIASTPIQLPISAPGVVASARVRYLEPDKARVSWESLVYTGGAQVTGFTVEAKPGGASCSTRKRKSCVVRGLDAGRSYTFSVSARNAFGIGDPSPPVVAGRLTGNRYRVTGLEARLTEGSVLVTWRPPRAKPEARVVGYVLRTEGGQIQCVTRRTKCTLTEVPLGVPQTFLAVAVMDGGQGPVAKSNVIVRPVESPTPPIPKPTQVFN